MTFEQIGNQIVLGELRTFSPINPGTEYFTSVAGFVRVDAARYVLAWEEQPQNYADTHLYATTIDFDVPVPASTAAPRRARSTHSHSHAKPCD